MADPDSDCFSLAPNPVITPTCALPELKPICSEPLICKVPEKMDEHTT